jgi:chemotaxis protein methyltransferase CheR
VEGYAEFREFLERTSGIHLGENKQYLVKTRLAGVMREHGFDSLPALLGVVRGPGNTPLRQRVVDAMTTNETQWFRDAVPFRILQETVLPALGASGAGRLRIWSAACSTGQEAYSISMAVEELRQRSPGRLAREVEVVGTDLSSNALAVAQSGVYDDMALSRGLAPERRDRFFLRRGAAWQVREEVRRRCSFRQANLLQSFAALGRFDVIFCRNVLIYFARANKVDILTRMARALSPQGYLFLGASEALPQEVSELRMERVEGGVLYRPAQAVTEAAALR